MCKGPFANICEEENNKIEKKMVRLEQKKEALASSFSIRLSSAEW